MAKGRKRAAAKTAAGREAGPANKQISSAAGVQTKTKTKPGDAARSAS